MADILLVEDDASDLAVALRAFRKHGLAERVEVARDGEEALERLRPARPADLPRVVFLDLRMPKISGLEVLSAVRAEEALADLPVVVISSSDRDADIRDSYRLGANSYLRKRLDPKRPGEYLVDAARYWLELNRTPR